MFDTINHTQEIADIFKAILFDLNEVPKQSRMLILRHIQRLERCAWHPAAMQDAVEACPVEFNFDTDGNYDYVGSQADVADAIESIIHKYVEIMDCEDDPFADLFDMHEAATYLGISYDMMKTYVSREKRIRGKQIGRSMVFTRAQIDNFRDNEMKSPGRPSD